MTSAHAASFASFASVRLIIDCDDLYINEDVTYRCNLLSYINTIVNRHFNGLHPKIYLQIFQEGSLWLVDITASEERSNAQEDIK